MLKFSVVLVGVLVASSALAGPKEEACVVEAISKLPPAQGLKITSSAVRAVPPVNKVQFYGVTLTIEAAGHAVGYEFLCRDDGPDDVAIVRRKIVG